MHISHSITSPTARLVISATSDRFHRLNLNMKHEVYMLRLKQVLASQAWGGRLQYRFFNINSLSSGFLYNLSKFFQSVFTEVVAGVCLIGLLLTLFIYF